jgi:acetylornithine deacetylase/succinyl-diaminopimelate desuccinylase-like protein
MSALSAGSAKEDLLGASQNQPDAMQRLAASAPAMNATLRTTCVATLLEGGHAMNALPQLAAATINCRVLPEDSPQYVEDTLRKVVADTQVTVSRSGDLGQGPASPLLPELMSAASRITNSMWPEARLVPNMVMGATDGRYLRIAGTPTYGIQGLFIDRNDIRFHGRDERIPVQSFYESQSFLYQLVKALSSD